MRATEDPAANGRAASDPGTAGPGGNGRAANGRAGARPPDRARPGGAGASAPGLPPALLRELGEGYRAGKRDFLGIGLSCMSDADFVGAVREAVRTRARLTVSFINPDYVVRGHQTPGLVAKMNGFDVVLPDGWGIVLGGRALGLPVPDRQGNDDICPKIFALSAADGFSNFLFGCGEGVPEKAAENLVAAFPGLPIAGTLHGFWMSRAAIQGVMTRPTST